MTSRPRASAIPARDELLALLRAERHHLECSGVRRAALFGSAARGDATMSSDVDVLVVLDPNAHVGLVQFAKLREHLRKLFGRDVDLLSHRALRPERDGATLDEAVWAF